MSNEVYYYRSNPETYSGFCIESSCSWMECSLRSDWIGRIRNNLWNSLGFLSVVAHVAFVATCGFTLTIAQIAQNYSAAWRYDVTLQKHKETLN